MQGSGRSRPKARTKPRPCPGQAGKAARLGRGWGGCQAPVHCGRGPETLRAVDERVQDADDLREAGPLGAVFMPAVKHELVQRVGAAHGCGQAVALLHGADDLRGNTALGWSGPLAPGPRNAAAPPGSGTHVPVGHVPVGPLPVGQHLPHDHPETPHVAGRGEGPEGDGLGGRPANGDLASL